MNLDKATQERLINIVRQAGQEIVMPNFRQLSAADVETKSSLTDLVTMADKASEAFITKEIQHAFPDWDIVGEEAVAEDPSTTDNIATADTCVIIDPIDGTRAFITGMPAWGILLGLVDETGPCLGVMHQPYLGETFCAARGLTANLRHAGHQPPLATRAY